MKLSEFVNEQARLVALFEAYWTHQAAKGLEADGAPIWPEAMGAGDWDEHFHMFEAADAEALGIVVREVDGRWVAEMSDNVSAEPAP